MSTAAASALSTLGSLSAPGSRTPGTVSPDLPARRRGGRSATPQATTPAHGPQRMAISCFARCARSHPSHARSRSRRPPCAAGTNNRNRRDFNPSLQHRPSQPCLVRRACGHGRRSSGRPRAARRSVRRCAHRLSASGVLPCRVSWRLPTLSCLRILMRETVGAPALGRQEIRPESYGRQASK
jgi:hypothetical protein